MFDNWNESRGLSPVIGVVLLVGLTVILVAVVGGFVTDFGSDVEAAPNAQIGVDFNDEDGWVNISHDSGNDINPDTLQIEYEDESDGSTYNASFNDAINGSSVEGLIQAGDEYDINVSDSDGLAGGEVASGDTFQIIWEGESGGNREILLEEIVP